VHFAESNKNEGYRDKRKLKNEAFKNADRKIKVTLNLNDKQRNSTVYQSILPLT
jgi:hypothetical protein